MKVALFTIIFLGTTALGYGFSQKYKNRISFFTDLVLFCNMLGNEIKFNKLTLSNIVVKHSSSFNSSLNQVINNYFINKKAIEKIIYLNEKENSLVASFLQSLGKHNVSVEISNILNYKAQFEQLVLEKKKDYEKTGVLGTKLGFLSGLLLCIVLI